MAGYGHVEDAPAEMSGIMPVPSSLEMGEHGGAAPAAAFWFPAVQDYAIFTLDVEGFVTSWNLGAEHTEGYLPAEIIGHHFSILYPTEDILAGKVERQLYEVTRTGRAEYEFWHVRKDGSRFWAHAAITAIVDDGGELIGFGNIIRVAGNDVPSGLSAPV